MATYFIGISGANREMTEGVTTLIAGEQVAGRHTAVWDGRDDRGERKEGFFKRFFKSK